MKRSSNRGPYRSVVDYDTDDQLRRALIAMPNTAAPSRLTTSRTPPAGEDLDWIISVFDPNTTESQSMKEELRRLQVLKSYLVLDSEREQDFERISDLAARTLNAPIALVSLVDLGRQYFIGNHGLAPETRETPRKLAFCAHTILTKPADENRTGTSKYDPVNHDSSEKSASNTMLVVPDASLDFRFRDNPFVTGPPHVRFYAGAPLISPEGYKLGTICVIDSQSRPGGLSQNDRDTLNDLAALTMKLLVDRKFRLENSEKNPAQLIACTAHDLMTPLTGVQLSLSLLKEDDDVKHLLGPNRMELLNTAASCSDIMARICQTSMDGLRGKLTDADDPSDLLHLSHGSEAGLPVTRMDDLIGSLHMLMDPIQKKVPIIISLDKAVPECVVGDDLKLFRSALNLMSNAAIRTTSGSIHLRIFVQRDLRTCNDSYNLEINQEEVPMLVFECEDTGSDVVDEDIFFQPTRSCSSLSLENSGAHLGLSSVASLVDSMDGKYGFRSRRSGTDGQIILDSKGRPCQGAVFWFSIPLSIPDNVQNHASGLASLASSCAALDDLNEEDFSTRTCVSRLSPYDKTAALQKYRTRTLELISNAVSQQRVTSLEAILSRRSSSSFRSMGQEPTSKILRDNKGLMNAIFSSHHLSMESPQNVQRPQHGTSYYARNPSSSMSRLRAGRSAPVLSAASYHRHGATHDTDVNYRNANWGTTTGAMQFSGSIFKSINMPRGTFENKKMNASNGHQPFHEGINRRGDIDANDVWRASIRNPVSNSNDDNIVDSSVSFSRETPNISQARTQHVPQALPSVPVATGPRPRRALVIEDSLVVRKSLARALNKIGFSEVTQAVDGMEGLKELKKQLFDIVLCDFLMPVMDGLDCVKQYRAWEVQNRPWFRQLIIGISAHANMNDSGQGIEAGMDSFKPKPISIKTLTEPQESEIFIARSKQLDDLDERNNSACNANSGHKRSIEEASDKKISETPNLWKSSNDNLQQKLKRLKAAPACLLASDTPSLQSSQVLTYLEGSGWRVVVVHEGKEVLSLLKTRNWDAVLIDDDIAKENGECFISAFRKWEETNRVNRQKNIFLVCDGDIPSPSDKSSIIQAPYGCNGVLRKPVPLKDLRYLLEKNESNSSMDIVTRN